jgi:pentatricopeptide repeat protein
VHDIWPNLISLTALLEGYFKIGKVASARDTFDLMNQCDVVAWMAMIVGMNKMVLILR